MMEQSLIGADIMPAAAHLTASMLSSAQPAQPYERTRIYTRPYGRVERGGVAIGSLDLAGGVLALVLPLTVASGSAWTGARGLLARCYRDIAVIAIAATGSEDRAFSADTGMAEDLVLAVKREERIDAVPEDVPTLFVNLVGRPDDINEATGIARMVETIRDGDRGFIRAGEGKVGSFIRATLADGGCAALGEPYVGAAAVSLRMGVLRLPGVAEALDLPLESLAMMGQLGLYHMYLRH